VRMPWYALPCQATQFTCTLVVPEKNYNDRPCLVQLTFSDNKVHSPPQIDTSFHLSPLRLTFSCHFRPSGRAKISCNNQKSQTCLMASLYTSIHSSDLSQASGMVLKKRGKKEIKNEENEKQRGRSMQVGQQQHWWIQSKQN